eukprot:scaffold110010_cov22-Tisochrysis_lutea.AAC.1
MHYGQKGLQGRGVATVRCMGATCATRWLGGGISREQPTSRRADSGLHNSGIVLKFCTLGSVVEDQCVLRTEVRSAHTP